MSLHTQEAVSKARSQRAAILAKTGSLERALSEGVLEKTVSLTLSEALVLGLWKQGVSIFYSVLGHGSTEIGEVLRIYQEAGLVKVYGVHSEIEASHAAVALRWVTGEKAAVVTSIGPGAMQAFAASLVPASNGLGVWYLFGDETTEDEGFNMQQVPRHEQGSFLKMMSVIGNTYSLHTPGALCSCLQRGTVTVDHPTKAGPFFVLLPMNTQAAWIEEFNLEELPQPLNLRFGAAKGDYALAAEWIAQANRVLIKVGGGGRNCEDELITLLDQSKGVLVHTPKASGCIPYSHPVNMGVGGSKGSLCGNHAMENADLLIAIGTRAVCQSDCSRTGYPNVRHVININTDVEDAAHYNKTLPFVGDIQETLKELNRQLPEFHSSIEQSEWQKTCQISKMAWEQIKSSRFENPVLYNEYWQREVLTQPAAIKCALDWAKKEQAVTFFDAGDVQANGFQIVEDETPDLTYTETGASYMGFAVSALLATNTGSKPFYGLAITGDGSLWMNPQILVDGVEFNARGCFLVLDNSRMAAISGLQEAQYGAIFATSHQAKVDYCQWANAIPGIHALHGGYTTESLMTALNSAKAYGGLSLIHVPVYFGENELGGMGVYGSWNVGNWCVEVQNRRHQIGL